MIRLTATTQKLQALLGGAVATNQVPFIVCYSDKTAANYSGGTQIKNSNGGSAVDILDAPAASTIRDVDYLSVKNIDTAAVTATIRFNDNGTTYTIWSIALAVGDHFTFTHAAGARVVDANGNEKTSAALVIGGAVTGGTANRVLYEGAGPVLADSANLTFDGTTLTAHTLTVSTGALTVTAGQLAVDTTTDSTSTITGSIQTDGGLGVAKALWVGGLANIAGATSLAGQTLIGYGTAINVAGNTGQQLQVATDSSAAREMAIVYYAADSDGPLMLFGKSRGTLGVIAYPLSGDVLGDIWFTGASNANARFEVGAAITVKAGSTWTASNRHTEMTFAPVASGSTARAITASITSAGVNTNAIGVYSGTTATLYNTTATTVNAFGAATTIKIGGATSNVIIGATSLGGRLDVVGGTAIAVVANGTVSGTAVALWHNKDTTGDNLFQTFHTEGGGTLRGSISYNRTGNLVAYNTTSDQRLKRDLGIAKDTRVLQSLRIHDFVWAESGNAGIGVFAQEAYDVYAGAVTVGGDTKTKPWGVSYSAYVPHLIVGWQNHESRLAALEAIFYSGANHDIQN